jgi:hypothetical protein
MKAYLLFSLLLIGSAAFAQDDKEPKHIRETLFGGARNKGPQTSTTNARKAADPRTTATSTRSLIFNDYKPQSNKSAARAAKKSAPAGKPGASAVSQKEAAANAPKQTAPVAPVIPQESTDKKN